MSYKKLTYLENNCLQCGILKQELEIAKANYRQEEEFAKMYKQALQEIKEVAANMITSHSDIFTGEEDIANCLLDIITKVGLE